MTKMFSWSRVPGLLHAAALTVLLPIVPGGAAQPQVAPARYSPEPEAYQFSVDLDLVVLPAIVRDQHGHYVSDLNEQDFAVYEDGVPQRIRLFRREDTPVIAGLLIDHSGSMRPKLAGVTAAARIFAESSNPEDQLFIVNFNETVSLGLPSAIRFTTNAEDLGNAIWRAPAVGQTALYDAVIQGLQHLETGDRTKKVLIVISDGGDNASKHSLAQVLQRAEQSSAILYTVGLVEPDSDDRDANPKVLNRLARASGGEAFFPGEVSSVVSICERIARDIRNQYTIGYVSSSTARNGAHRTIRVVARAPGHGKLAVRTRTGYVARSQASIEKGEGVK